MMEQFDVSEQKVFLALDQPRCTQRYYLKIRDAEKVS